MKYYLLTTFFIFYFVGVSQEESKSKFDISISYGPAANFFVDYGRPIVKENGNFIPPVNVFGDLELIQKQLIGTIGGIELNYHLSERSDLGIVYERQINYGKFNLNTTLNNGTQVFVDDIKLRHLNQFFAVNYKLALNKSRNFKAIIGLYYLKLNQAEININLSANFLEIEERNVKNSNLEEAGFFTGLEYYFYKSGQFEFGIQSKLYVTVSTGEFEALSITPKLKYNF